MKIDLSQVLRSHKGTTLKHEGEDATLGLICYAALCNPADPGAGRDDRLKRGRLAQRVIAAGEAIELKAEEVTLIKQCIGSSFGPWIVVLTEDMLEGIAGA